jgi:putative membrane protein
VNYFVRHWSFDPILILLVLTVWAHEIGLRRLGVRSTAARTNRRRRSSYLFYAGLVVLDLAIESPIDYWSSNYFFVHMLEHILLSFFAPMLIVVGAPWIPLMFALPVRWRRSLGRFFYLNSKAKSFRIVGRFIRNPWVAVISFNVTMLVWHIPSWFDVAEQNSMIHIWLMHGSFIVTGVLFWLQIIPSYPLKTARGPVFQVSAIVATNVIMTVLAISMSILTAVSWYSTYDHVPGVTLAPFADQQIGAAILWVCGDFWALPVVLIIIRRAIENDGSLTGAFDRLMGRGAAPSIASFRPVVNGEVVTSSDVVTD